MITDAHRHGLKRRYTSRSRSGSDSGSSDVNEKKKKKKTTTTTASSSALASSSSSSSSGREALPVQTHRQQLLDTLREHQVVICVGETGSGKTTQIPQFLVQDGYTTATSRNSVDHQEDQSQAKGKCIAITQPRRVATIAVAERVALEMGERLDHPNSRVGYAIRFDDRTSSTTQLKFMTDGILVRECLKDPLLTKYSVVMLDEAHERSIHTDVLLGLLKQLIRKRRDIKLLVTSATLDAKRFARFFGSDARIVRIPGRSFPVDLLHSKTLQIMGTKGPISSYLRNAVETTLQVHHSEPYGHVLVFLTGQQEIDQACREIKRLEREHGQQGNRDDPLQPARPAELRVYPLYGALTGSLQRRIFESVDPKLVRKVIVATNIAETSLTIDGIRYVIDSGFTKQKAYNPLNGMESLVVVPISQVSAQQRAGRAGRTAPGKCFRLYNKGSYEQMLHESIPEIKRVNLANTVLYLKVLGIDDVLRFEFLDAPQEDAILDALKQLFVLGAIDSSGKVTPLGYQMAEFPLEPRLSRSLVESVRLGCEEEVVIIVSMLSVENLFVTNRHGSHSKRRKSHRQGHAKWEPDLDGEEDEEEDEEGSGSHLERQMVQLQRDGLLDDAGDHLSYLRLFQAWDQQFSDARSHRRNSRQRASTPQEDWCEQRGLHARAFRMASAIRHQLRDIVKSAVVRGQIEMHSPVNDVLTKTKRIKKAVCAGFFMNSAQRCANQSTIFRHVLESEFQLLHLHPLSTILVASSLPSCCVYHELVHTSKSFMRHVLQVPLLWIQEYAKDKSAVSEEQLYALSGHQKTTQTNCEGNRDDQDHNSAVSQATANKTTRVDSAVLAAARSRFLARKRFKHA